jgi:hypothetical protein
MLDRDGLSEQGFNDAVLLAGRSCRDALRRVCVWHQQHDAALICDPKPVVYPGGMDPNMKM